jgi:acetyltransferase-like isoleucine patch superfamily enzyme
MWFLKNRFASAGHLTILGKYHIIGFDKIALGDKFFGNKFLRIEVFGTDKEISLQIGNNVSFGDSVHLGVLKSIKIGNNVLVGSRVLIIDHNHGIYKGNGQTSPDVPPNLREIYAEEVEIEDNVWIGDGVAVLPGVRIGFGSIIGANSVVSKNIPSMTIAAGNPCEPKKRYNQLAGTWEKI